MSQQKTKHKGKSRKDKEVGDVRAAVGLLRPMCRTGQKTKIRHMQYMRVAAGVVVRRSTKESVCYVELP